MAFATFPLEHRVTTLALALCLRDAWTLEATLAGIVTATTGGVGGWRKDAGGTFLFFGVPAGVSSFAVRSDPATPFYRAVDIAAMVPNSPALSPAWPDPALADPSLALADPAQPAAYRAQFAACALLPSVAYPFDPAATVLRGTVTSGGVPVPGVTVSDLAGHALSYVTGDDGEFVLPFYTAAAGASSATVRASRTGHADIDTPAPLRRGATTTLQINV